MLLSIDSLTSFYFSRFLSYSSVTGPLVLNASTMILCSVPVSVTTASLRLKSCAKPAISSRMSLLMLERISSRRASTMSFVSRSSELNLRICLTDRTSIFSLSSMISFENEYNPVVEAYNNESSIRIQTTTRFSNRFSTANSCSLFQTLRKARHKLLPNFWTFSYLASLLSFQVFYPCLYRLEGGVGTSNIGFNAFNLANNSSTTLSHSPHSFASARSFSVEARVQPGR